MLCLCCVHIAHLFYIILTLTLIILVLCVSPHLKNFATTTGPVGNLWIELGSADFGDWVNFCCSLLCLSKPILSRFFCCVVELTVLWKGSLPSGTTLNTAFKWVSGTCQSSIHMNATTQDFTAERCILQHFSVHFTNITIYKDFYL